MGIGVNGGHEIGAGPVRPQAGRRTTGIGDQDIDRASGRQNSGAASLGGDIGGHRGDLHPKPGADRCRCRLKRLCPTGIQHQINARFGQSLGTPPTEAGRAEVLAAAGQVDILITNAGGPPPGLWSDWTRADFMAAIDANMLTPIALMSALMPAMMERGWGRVVNITSQSVKAPVAQLGLSNTAPHRADRLCRRHLAAGGAGGCHHQQSATGDPCDRPGGQSGSGQKVMDKIGADQ